MSKLLLKKPLITEKSATLGARGAYVFMVDKNATKPEIKKTIQQEYKVTVTGVNILNTKPKTVHVGRGIGTKPGFKKAIVTLKAGDNLDVLPTAPETSSK
ncbi:MAG: 50S ribosomal protein L23 [bacterium]|nr:50S ribosomal protein L23 [bacterium]